MQLVIDPKFCESQGITMAEFIILYGFKHNLIRMDFLRKQISDGNLIVLGNQIPVTIDKVCLTKKGEERINSILEKLSISETQVNKSRLEHLAEGMCALFPEGKMPGTKYSWQGGPALIALRLKSFIKKFGDFTDEQFLDATRRYVADYAKQNYQYMQLLKYFIWKDDDVKGLDSQLLTYIVHPEMGTEDTDIGNATLV